VQQNELSTENFIIGVYEFNPKVHYEDKIMGGTTVFSSQTYLEGNNYYFATAAGKVEYNDPTLPSIYHKPFKQDLTKFPTISSTYCTITFNPIDYSVSVTAIPETFYHIYLAGNYSSSGKEITNMNLSLGTGMTLL